MKKKFPGVADHIVVHCVALVAAFDTAVSFGLSFGIAKFQLNQKEVKLVGEMAGSLGRRPNPVICEAIRNWPPVLVLQHLQ